MSAIIGRTEEIELLTRYMKSGKSEFIALYGRLRIGKTFLITNFFENKFTFDTSGIISGTKKDEMSAFYNSMCTYGYTGKRPRTWMEMFAALRTLLQNDTSKGRKVLFIDELPCFDTRCSGFIKAFDFFWNTWASRQSDIMLIVCGSATSWMVRNIINNRGGLHNRITHEMHLRAFNLKETKQYLWRQGIKWNNMLVAQVYMIMGGIPYYLSMLDQTKGLAENIDKIYFSENAEMKSEYNRLYMSLFNNPKPYIDVIQLLAKHKKGLTRKEISEKLKTAYNGHLSDVLENLEYCDFIRGYYTLGKQVKTYGQIFQLIDQYSLFYHYFDKLKTKDVHYWTFTLGTPVQNTWYGLAFERLAMSHIQQILSALHIDRMHTEYYSWRNNGTKTIQIDLVIDQADGITNVCEVKYSNKDFVLDKKECNNILNRKGSFEDATNNERTVRLVLITTKALQKNVHSDIFQNVVLLKDLFE